MPKPKKDKLNRKRLATDYGFALAFMESDPELKRLFNQAVKQTWTSEKFVAKLRDTRWFKTHSVNVRNAIMQETADPATYKANVRQMHSTVRDTWEGMFGPGGLPREQIWAWAETAHRMGWSEAQLVDRLSRGINYRKMLRKKNLGGTAAQVEQQVAALAQNYGLKPTPKYMAQQVERVVEGHDTIEGIQNRIREQAKRNYRAFADQIDGGATVTELAEPYRQKMAELLEMNANDIPLHGRMLREAMNQRTKDGKAAAMDMNDFADMIRRDKRWQHTDNAREEYAGVTEGLLRQFGMLA